MQNFSVTINFSRIWIKEFAFRYTTKPGRLFLSNLLVDDTKSLQTFCFRQFHRTMKADAAKEGEFVFVVEEREPKRNDPSEITSCALAKLNASVATFLLGVSALRCVLLYVSSLAGRELRIAPFAQNINHG
jgi:hypothetical protein